MRSLTWIRSRLTDRADTEHEQAILRVLIGIGLGTYLLYSANYHLSNWIFTSWAHLIVIPAFMVASLVIIACILVWPKPSPARRLIANAIDIFTLTFIMVVGEDVTAPVFFIYLWVTFGCGFRFGANYLLVSLGLSSIGFMLVLNMSDYWTNHRMLGIGLWTGTILVSLYVLTLIKSLHKAIQRSEAANQAKRTFVSSVSHELRTPLNAIIGMNELLRSTPLNVEQAEMINATHGASRLMLSLIEDVLDFSKIEAGKITVESADFDLHALIQGTMSIFSLQAAQKGLKLGTLVMPEVTPSLKGDARRLQQTLVNLLGNALKFTEQGEVRLVVSTLTESPQSVRLRFTVRDTGIGIAPADQQRIFESFAQAGSPEVRKHRGTGLGTTIAKRLVELMGGAIGVESAPGAGSTFWFDLPFAKQELSGEASPAHFKDSPSLLVGFPDHARQALEASIHMWGLESGSAANFATAAELLSDAAAMGRPYRVALVYAENAGADVERAARELRSHVGTGLALILCAPRETAAQCTSHMPAEFASVIALPPEKRLLYNALHSVLVGNEATEGTISLAEYYRNKAPTRCYRVLVADDDPTNRSVISMQLERAGHTARLVADGEQALDALAAEDYDAVILDSQMPVMTGIEATRLIRVMQAGRAGVPIILFSADSTPETIQEATDAGIDAFLAKPIEANKLYSTLEEIVTKRARETTPTVQKIAQLQPAQAPLLNSGTLRELARMSQDTQFVPHLVRLFCEDSTQLLLKIEGSLAHRRRDEFKAHIHALKGSALNLGAERLFAHCARIGAFDHSTLDASAESLAAETRAIITQTQTALADYVQNRSGAADPLPSPIPVSLPASQRRTNPQPRHLISVDSASARSASSSADLSRRA